MKELTVIIPFLNEGVEVERTIQSLMEHTKESIDIILINDCSNDAYNYIEISKRYGARYIENKERCGVARCREIGIEKTETKFFLLLDAHMRVYDSNWYSILINALENEPTTLFCLQSIVLLNICGIIKEKESMFTCGAFLETNPNIESFLDVSWNSKSLASSNKNENSTIMEIPCVLGAGYACNKFYWNKIHGLRGLRNYGLDEQLISLKVWMSGGKCKLISNISFGHIYRQMAPYNISSADFLYNKLFLSKVLLPNSYSDKYGCFLQQNYPDEFKECCTLLEQNKTLIKKEREYFKQIKTRNFEDFLNINNKVYFKPDISNVHFEKTLAYVLTNSALGIGLFTGKAGIALIYMLLARRDQKELYEMMADMIFQQIWASCSVETPISFSNGLLGIGWLCEFLHQNQMVVGNPDEILKDLDNIVNTTNPAKLKDASFDNGVIGLSAYVYARIIGCKQRKKTPPFNKQCLNNIVRASFKAFKNDDLAVHSISYIQDINVANQKLTKNNFLDLLNVSSYRNLPICVCIGKLLHDDNLL